MYEEEEIVEEPQQPFSDIRSQQEIDNKAISSFAKKGNEYYFVLPIHSKKMQGVIFKDAKGKPVKLNGQFLFEEKEINVFKGFESKKIKLPIPEFFNDGVPSATLTASDVEFIREIDSLIPFIASKMVKEGKNFSSVINLLYYLKNSFTDSAKGFEGRGITMAKTTISKGEMISQMYKKDEIQQNLVQQQKKGFWDKLGRGQ